MSLSPDQKLAAYFLGRRIAGQRRKQDRVPVAYLYNGVRLPPLPEWDMEKYPYADIYYSENEYGNYVLRFKSKPFEKMIGFDALKFDDAATAYYRAENDKWVYNSGSESSRGMTFYTDFVWTNTDLILSDGTVIMAASEPIPVYK